MSNVVTVYIHSFLDSRKRNFSSRGTVQRAGKIIPHWHILLKMLELPRKSGERHTLREVCLRNIGDWSARSMAQLSLAELLKLLFSSSTMNRNSGSGLVWIKYLAFLVCFAAILPRSSTINNYK